jgi:hypothetical protein
VQGLKGDTELSAERREPARPQRRRPLLRDPLSSRER